MDGTLTTFGCVEWESEQFRGVMRARCSPFKMPKRRFHGVNPQVYMVVYPIIYSTYMYIPVRPGMYQYIPVCTATSTYFSIPGHTGMSWYVLVHGAHMYIPVCTGMYWYVQVHSSMYWYILVCTGTYSYVLLCTGVLHPYLQCYSLSDGLWCVQDTIIVVPPFPYSIAEVIDDIPFDDCW